MDAIPKRRATGASEHSELVEATGSEDRFQFAFRQAEKGQAGFSLPQPLLQVPGQPGIDDAAFELPPQASKQRERGRINYIEEKLSTDRQPIVKPVAQFDRDGAAMAEHPQRINEFKTLLRKPDAMEVGADELDLPN